LVKKKTASNKAVRQVERSIRDIRARSKALLKAAQLDVREYRKQLATLKKQEIVSRRVDVRSHQPTRYMLGKLKKFKGVALGHELAVPISKVSTHRARQYTDRGIANRIEKFLIVPKTAAKQKADVYKGHIRTTTQLERGEIAEVKYPATVHDMHDIVQWLADHEQTLNQLKGPRDQFGFQLSGHNSRQGLANIRELIAYLMKYDGSNPRERGDIFKSKSAIQEFVIFRFRPERGSNRPNLEPYYGVKRYSKGRTKDRKDQRRGEEYRREKEREKKARQRMAEDKETYENRIAKQRQRDRANANTRREKRMAKRLLG
jgi:hypothetical protein